jgi:hypothetical protein
MFQNFLFSEYLTLPRFARQGEKLRFSYPGISKIPSISNSPTSTVE